MTIPGIDSAMGCYVNPHGVVHDTVTVCEAQGVQEEFMRPTMKDTWFSGFGWIILYCHFCDQHMGWKFVKLIPNAPGPAHFYGFTRGSISMCQVDTSSSDDSTKAIHFSKIDLQHLLLRKNATKYYRYDNNHSSTPLVVPNAITVMGQLQRGAQLTADFITNVVNLTQNTGEIISEADATGTASEVTDTAEILADINQQIEVEIDATQVDILGDLNMIDDLNDGEEIEPGEVQIMMDSDVGD